ncbi:MAG: hypothetical protein M3P34_08930 [Actinomycetota bacterium]|nr:hypothetical protein [Actinomycetota bacterium]
MTDSEVDVLVAALSNSTRAQAPAGFPVDARAAANPGLYSWWGDEEGRRVLAAALDVDELPPLLYAGQAGATKWPSGKRSNATLRSRIGQQHIRGNARSSTFRLTLSTILLVELGLTPATGGRLTPDSNRVVSDWIAAHLRVAIVPFPDRDRLGVVEAAVVGRLDPPLNLDHCASSALRARLTELRRALPRR